MANILACIDASIYATSVVDHAAWAAWRLGRQVEILHVIQRKDAVAARHDLSGAVGLGAKSSLMEELVAIDEAEGRLAQEKGRALLSAAKAHIEGLGFNDSILTHRHGGIVETIIEREADAELVVIGKRGASANFAKGHLGSKVERAVRQSVKPVLVASRAFKEPETVIVAFDGGPSARKAIQYVAMSPLFTALKVHVVMAGREADGTNAASLNWARELLATRADTEVNILDGKPEEVIISQIAALDAHLLVMGAYGHSPLRSMIVGSTTTEMVRSCSIPVLLFR